MNYRLKEYEFLVEAEQVEELTSAFVKMLVYFRSTGKYNYSSEMSTFQIGVIGNADKLCDFIGIGYTMCSSDELDSDLTRSITEFTNALRNSRLVDGQQRGKLTLSFYEKKLRTNAWLPTYNKVPWEIWVLNLKVFTMPNLSARVRHASESKDQITNKILQMIVDLNEAIYQPKSRVASDQLHLTYCTKYSDVQPYLFEITYETGYEIPQSSLQTAVRRFFSETLGL